VQELVVPFFTFSNMFVMIRVHLLQCKPIINYKSYIDELMTVPHIGDDDSI
jgi:hypothetical protein